MSVDTKAISDRMGSGGLISTKGITDLCDEIDRLSRLLEQETVEVNKANEEIDGLRKALGDARNLYDLSNGSFQEENEKLRAELAELRERQRPRRIKDEPPPLSKDILMWRDAVGAWLQNCVLDREAVFGLIDKFWIPQPPAPPPPDPFEVWFDSFCKGDSSIACHREDCRFAWDAALSSVKKDANPC